MDVVLAPITAGLQVPGFNKVHRGQGEIDLTGDWKAQCLSIAGIPRSKSHQSLSHDQNRDLASGH